MKAFDKIINYIDSLDERKFYAYLSGLCGITLLLCGLILYYFYSSMSELNERINTINDQRIQVKHLLTTYEQVKKQRSEVDTLFTQGGFLIGGYFTTVLSKLHLQGARTDITRVDHEGKYSESILKAQLTDLNMRQLTELLSELEQNVRIYTKDLEINKSKKNPRALDIVLTIATLEPKT